jgi:geranylgeranyl pyrophosphate synthase
MELAAVPSVAVELVHTYSLIHDDLPAMDDDELRRGMPTCHKAFGEALAILAGDALQSRAFEVLSTEGYKKLAGAEIALNLVSELASAIGPSGMAGGQAMDMRAASGIDELRSMHAMKTGALICFCTRAGAIISGTRLEEADRLGALMGIAFQVRDDILDATSTPEELGKTPGKDERQGKLTYVTAYGLDRSKSILEELLEEARGEIEKLPCDRRALISAIGSLKL